MESTNSRKAIAENHNHYSHFFVWVTLIIILIAMGGCTPLPPQPPTIKTINIGSRLDPFRKSPKRSDTVIIVVTKPK